MVVAAPVVGAGWGGGGRGGRRLLSCIGPTLASGPPARAVAAGVAAAAGAGGRRVCLFFPLTARSGHRARHALPESTFYPSALGMAGVHRGRMRPPGLVARTTRAAAPARRCADAAAARHLAGGPPNCYIAWRRATARGSKLRCIPHALPTTAEEASVAPPPLRPPRTHDCPRHQSRRVLRRGEAGATVEEGGVCGRKGGGGCRQESPPVRRRGGASCGACGGGSGQLAAGLKGDGLAPTGRRWRVGAPPPPLEQAVPPPNGVALSPAGHRFHPRRRQPPLPPPDGGGRSDPRGGRRPGRVRRACKQLLPLRGAVPVAIAAVQRHVCFGYYHRCRDRECRRRGTISLYRTLSTREGWGGC